MDTRDWQQQRRGRTRRLIELGGLVSKSGLAERIAALEPDQVATLLGALLELADQLEHAPDRVARWRRRGRDALRDPA